MANQTKIKTKKHTNKKKEEEMKIKVPTEEWLLPLLLLVYLLASDIMPSQKWNHQRETSNLVESRGIHFDNRLEIIPMEGKSFGANVYGFNPEQAISDDQMIASIRQALETHLVLVFHNVSESLSPALHLQLSRRLGPVDPVLSSAPSYLKKGVFNSPDQVRRAIAAGADPTRLGDTMLRFSADAEFPKGITRIVKEPSDVVAFGEGWHSDLTYRPATPFAAVLVSRQLPSIGGNTHFLDMRQVYDALPTDTKSAIEHLQANHSDGHRIWSSHPVVRHDHSLGQKSLFVNKAFTRNIIRKQGSSAQDTELLEWLLQRVEDSPHLQPHAFLDIKWRPGQMVAWDNRYTQHAANADYVERREMHRTIISGTVPF